MSQCYICFTLMLQVSNVDVTFFIDMFHVDLNVTHNIKSDVAVGFFYQWMAIFFP
jgi:hypothetical protein